MVGTPRGPMSSSPASETSDAVDISEYLTREGRHSALRQDGYELDSNPSSGEEDVGGNRDQQGNASRDGATIAALLDELDSIQTTYGRITQAFGNSEKENSVLVATLQQLMTERNELLQRIARRSVSRERQVSVYEANTQSVDALRMRVDELERDNRRLQQQLDRRSPSADRPPDVASPVCKPPDGVVERNHGPSSGSAEDPSTTIASMAVSPEGTATMQSQQQRLQASTMDASRQHGGGMGSSMEAQIEAHAEQQEMLFRAHEEKLWMIIRTRGRELEHVCKLLASTERRNAELVAVLADLCCNVAEQKSLDARQQHQQSDLPPPAAAAAGGQMHSQRARGGGTSVGSGRRGSAVLSPSTAVQRGVATTTSAPTQIRRGSIVPPPPQRLPTSGNASAAALPLAPKAMPQRPVSPAAQAHRRRSIVAASDAPGDLLLVEKPRWS